MPSTWPQTTISTQKHFARVLHLVYSIYAGHPSWRNGSAQVGPATRVKQANPKMIKKINWLISEKQIYFLLFCCKLENIVPDVPTSFIQKFCRKISRKAKKFVKICWHSNKAVRKKSTNLTKFLSKTCWDILYNELVIFLLAIFVEQYVLTTAVPKFQHIFFHQFNIFLRVNSLIVQVSAVRRPKINDVRANFVVYETILKHCMLATTRWMVLEK